MKKHKLLVSCISVWLIFVTLEISTQHALTGPPPITNQVDHANPQGVECIVFIIIAIVFGIIIWGLIQMCKRLPPPPPPNDGQPTNITIAVMVAPPDTFMQFQFDMSTLTTNANYFAGGNVTDESGNTYQLMCSYGLYCSSNAAGPWMLDALATNWMGGTMTVSSNHATVTLTNQEVALYDTNGQLLAARRWALSDGSLSNAMQPRIVMPPMHLPKEFYRLVLLEQ